MYKLFCNSCFFLVYRAENQEQAAPSSKTRVTADGTYATESVFVSASVGSREETR